MDFLYNSHRCGCSGGNSMKYIVALLLLPIAVLAQPAGKQFAIITVENDASTALAICIDNGGSLASVHSQVENDILASSLATRGIDSAWIGFTDFGNEAVSIDGSCTPICDQSCLDTFRWVDGTANDFTRFAAGEPNSGCCGFFFGCTNEEQDCVIIQSDGLWRDVDCGLSRQAFCIVDDERPDIEVNETLPPVSDLFPEGDRDYTGEIVLLVFITFLAVGSIGIAGFLGYIRYSRRSNRSSLTLNPKYGKESADNLSGSEGTATIRQTDFSRESMPWTPRESASKSSRFSAFMNRRQDRHSTSTTRTDRTSAFSFGGAIMKKYFQGRRETTDSERLSQMRREEEARDQEDQTSFGGSSYPVVSKMRL